MNERQTRMETQIFQVCGLKPLDHNSGVGEREEPWAVNLALRLQSLGGLKAPLTQQLALLEAGHGWAGLAGRRRVLSGTLAAVTALDEHHPCELSAQFIFNPHPALLEEKRNALPGEDRQEAFSAGTSGQAPYSRRRHNPSGRF